MARMSQRYSPETKERAVRLVADVRDQYKSEWAVIGSVAGKLGITNRETLRKWVRDAEVDAGRRPRVTSAESAELRRLARESSALGKSSIQLRDTGLTTLYPC